MIDHVSIGVRDLEQATHFYQDVLGAVGYTKLEARPATVGFGKTYPEFWINLRAAMPKFRYTRCLASRAFCWPMTTTSSP